MLLLSGTAIYQMHHVTTNQSYSKKESCC